MSQLLKRSIRFARRQSVEAKNQLLGKYPDRYGFLDFYNYMNKRPEQKSSLEQEVGSLSERLFSNNNDKILVFHLTDRGFYSEINNLLNAAIYCLHNNIGMVVNSKHFLYKEKAGWDDYFERFWEDANNAEHTRYFDLHYRQSVELWNRVRNYNYETVTMPALDLEGNAFENKRSIAQLIYRLKPDVQALLDKRIEQFKLPKTFAACHIRRGDKVGDMPGYPESERIDGSVYLDKVLEDFPDVRTLFVCSDAYQAVQEISECIHARGLNIRLVTTCLPDNVGHSTELLKQQFHRRFDSVMRLMVDVEVSARSTCFVGTYSSNMSRFVALMHTHPQRCFSLDEAWHVR